MRYLPPRLYGLFIAAALAMITSGCPRDKNRAAAPAALTPVKLLIDWKAEPTYAGFYLAKELGAYSRRGLDVTIIEGSGATTSAQVIAAGEYLVGSCSGEATAIARARGLPLKSVAVYYHNVPTVLYSRADTPIAKPQEMEGKRIGLIDGSISVDEYRGLVNANHIDRTKVQEVSVGWDVAPLLAKKVDGLMNYGELTPVELKLKGHQLAIMRFADFGVKAYSLNLIASEKALAEKADLVQKIVAATAEGFEALRKDPADAAARFSKLFPEKSPDYVRESMKVVAEQLGAGPVGVQTTEGWAATIKTLDELKLLQKPITVQEVAAQQFLAP